MKVSLLSASPYIRGDGDHVTLFLGVLELGRCGPEEELLSAKALTGVLRIPLSGLLIGLCLVGVSTMRVLLAGDLKGLPLRAIPDPRELPATGLSITESTCIFDKGGLLGVLGVWGVLGVLGVLFP